MLVIALILAVLAVRLSWGLYGAQIFEAVPAEAQGETGTCPNAQRIDEFTGTGSQETDTFNTTTDSFRISYELRDTGETTIVEPSLLISVNDQQGLPVSNASQDGPGTGESFVNEPAGTYFLDISAIGQAEYTVTVEQCEGGGADTNPSPGVPKQDPQQKAPSPASKASSPASKTPSPAPKAPSPAPSPNSGTLMEAGGAMKGPVPAMPDGVCPEEFPVEKGSGCYR